MFCDVTITTRFQLPEVENVKILLWLIDVPWLATQAVGPLTVADDVPQKTRSSNGAERRVAIAGLVSSVSWPSSTTRTTTPRSAARCNASATSVTLQLNITARMYPRAGTPYRDR